MQRFSKIIYSIVQINNIVSCTLDQNHMTQKIAEPIEFIMKSQIGGVLSKAFAQLYRTKPHFPVTHLANWLKQYSRSQHDKKQLHEKVTKSKEQHKRIEQEIKKKNSQKQEAQFRQKQYQATSQKQYHDTITETEHLEDLLQKWLPNYIEKRCDVAAAYIGSLTHPIRPIPAGNFEPGAEIDVESPKIIEYIGASDSQEKTMKAKILASEQGISFQCFNQPQPEPEQAEPAQGQDPKPPKQPKKTYIYIPDVTKNQKIHYFKFPRLGSYACFPLKLKSVLIESAFDQSINDYKEYVKLKEETQKQYNDKHNEMKNQYEEARKKYEEFQVPEEQGTPEQHAQKKALQQQASRLKGALTEFEKTPPVTPQPKFNFVQKCYLLGCDTLGQDRKITQQALDSIDARMSFFKKQFQKKQRAMLLHDILTFMEQQPKLQSLEHLYREHDKNAAAQSQEQAKQKGLKDKSLQFDIAATKAKKMDALFQDPNMQKSMKTYFNYNIPKFTSILQIALMFLGYQLKDINLPRKNVLDFRKVRQPAFIEQFLRNLSEYNLRPASAECCPDEYKINKLLQRLQKIDLEQVAKYNGFIWALANHIKSYCWTLILCRDAKKQSYEAAIKARQDRLAENDKKNEEMEKALAAVKAQLPEEEKEQFKDEEWIANYRLENPLGEVPDEPVLQQYLNID